LSLDKEDVELDIREVVTDSFVNRLDKHTTEPNPNMDVDFVFCPPSEAAKKLLILAYVIKPPDPEEMADLESCQGLWWTKGQVFVPSKL
jgi:hypothetical protein